MKYTILTLLLWGLLSLAFGQSKTVKLIIDSTKIYLNYFYKSKNVSDYTLNDSIQFICRKITGDKFYLDKFIYKQKAWTKIYRIELAKDSLHVTTRLGGRTGKHQFQYSKEPYYNSYLIDK
jgi:hypothetical protein